MTSPVVAMVTGRRGDVSVTSWTTSSTTVVTMAAVMYSMTMLTSRILIRAQTEGDTGYDYNDAYDDEYNDESVLGLEPSFDVPIVNVTVVAGQTAVLPCSVDSLGKYKVAWLDHSSIPLTYEERRVVDDTRFMVVRPYSKEWNLQIRNIQPEDHGQYRCTINTSPVKSKVIMLHVKVPPAIMDHLSSDGVTVQEGDTVILVCNVTGVPTPDVTWFRRPASGAPSGRERIGRVGEVIIIHNVTRYCDDIYECVASNGVPPTVTREMRVTVEFAPEITMRNRRIGQARGLQTILECVITAFPQTVNYWEKDGRKLSSSAKHHVDVYDDGAHRIVLSLRIHDIDHSDYGEYRCVSSNALGVDQQVMYLYEYSEPLIDSNRGQVAGEDAETVSAITPAPMTLYWLAAAGHRPTVTSRRPVAPHNGDRRHLVVVGQDFGVSGSSQPPTHPHHRRHHLMLLTCVSALTLALFVTATTA